MRERVVKTIGEIGREKGVTAVLGADHAIYYDAAADLTAAVIARLDAK
jgi:Skp family chaperone for outer membrane proteins